MPTGDQRLETFDTPTPPTSDLGPKEKKLADLQKQIDALVAEREKLGTGGRAPGSTAYDGSS